MPILKRIFVATDLSAAAHRAVMRAGQLARQWNAELFLVHVRPDGYLFARARAASHDRHQDIARYTHKSLREVLPGLEANFGVHARCDSRPGRASTVIAAMVAEHKPHLVVIGARGRHDSGEIGPVLGGTALKLLTRLEQPLLLVRTATPTAYTRSLVALDTASTLSRRTVLWGSGLVPGGDCHVLHAYDVPYFEPGRLRGETGAVIEEQRHLRQAYEEAMMGVQETLGAAEGAARVHRQIEHGEPVAMVLTEIALHAPQLVVIGKPDPRVPHVEQGMMGCVGFRIATQALVDVLIIS
jgi:nucleotide-binding universal stress UspA family protein